MIRILHVYPQLNNAGTEMVIMNLYRNFERDKIQFDFLVQKSGELDKVVQQMGAKVFYIGKGKKYAEAIEGFFREHSEYKTIHTHTHQEMGTVLKMAAKVGIPYRIAHSHNYRGDVPKFMKYYKMITGWDIEKYATHFLACSNEAAAWLFPRKYKQCEVWNNAIDIEKFIFSRETRSEYRKILDIPQDAKVICHVGRFAEQKNHKKIIALLNKLVKQDENVWGVLVGVGPLFEEIKSASKSDRILFLGNRTDVPKILCAADVFLFPSLYEGLGIVAVEAQASGIRCIASTNVPLMADLGIGVFEQISLEKKDEVWLESIRRALTKSSSEQREQISRASYSTNYNIKKIAQNAQDFYFSLR